MQSIENQLHQHYKNQLIFFQKIGDFLASHSELILKSGEEVESHLKTYLEFVNGMQELNKDVAMMISSIPKSE